MGTFAFIWNQLPRQYFALSREIVIFIWLFEIRPLVILINHVISSVAWICTRSLIYIIIPVCILKSALAVMLLFFKVMISASGGALSHILVIITSTATSFWLIMCLPLSRYFYTFIHFYPGPYSELHLQSHYYFLKLRSPLFAPLALARAPPEAGVGLMPWAPFGSFLCLQLWRACVWVNEFYVFSVALTIVQKTYDGSQVSKVVVLRLEGVLAYVEQHSRSRCERLKRCEVEMYKNSLQYILVEHI